MHVHVCVCVRMCAIAYVWRPENSLWGSGLFYYRILGNEVKLSGLVVSVFPH